jgi:hypothetical protein
MTDGDWNLSTRAATVGLLLLVSVASVWLAAELPPHAFYSGDSGVKLIAARNAIAHPMRPFEIDLPVIDGRPVPYVERFFGVHGGHAHAMQTPVFPVVSAPFIALFGLRGAYLLPLISFVTLLPVLARIARHVAPDVSIATLSLVGVFAGPVLFYAFEFWEHLPAIACLAGATALVAIPRAPPTHLIASGALSAAAILLRPEALWYVIALAGWQSHARIRLGYFVAAAALILGLFALFNLRESGNLMGPHLSANLAPLLDRWAEVRIQRGALWFWPGSTLWVVGVLVLIASWVATFANLNLRVAQAVALCAVVVMAAEAASGAYARESLWNCWPAGLLLFVPTSRFRHVAPMWWLTVFTVVAVWLSSTHDGGAQWGPRFVLIAAPAMMVLAAASASDAAGPGQARRFRQALVLIVFLAGLWTTRAAYRELRGTKQFYAELVQAVDTATEKGSVIVFSTWWFDQVVASLYSTRTFLYADGAPAAAAILKALQDADIRDAVLVWSREQAADGAITTAVAGTCYQTAHIHDIRHRELRVLKVTCGPRSGTD